MFTSFVILQLIFIFLFFWDIFSGSFLNVGNFTRAFFLFNNIVAIFLSLLSRFPQILSSVRENDILPIEGKWYEWQWISHQIP